MKLLALLTVLLSACTTAPTTPTPAPAPAPTDTSAATSTATSTDTSTSTSTSVYSPDQAAISQIVTGSACAKHKWTGRGVAPIGFVKGVAATYARSLCRYRSPDHTPAGVMGQAVGAASKDALAVYGLSASTGLERLKQNYTLLFGEGMMESSGNYGEGRDSSASNTDGETAESGLMQFSYNLRTASPMLGALYTEYQANTDGCMLATFKEGVTKPFNNRYSGSGEALAFQQLARLCPAFSVEYTAVGDRVRVGHWGPLKRHEAEFYQPCQDMLTQVEAATTCK